ncbi:MAG: MFS transporter [Gammaproteobacteria bacterium]
MRSILQPLDEASWNRFHTLITLVLGIGWLLDAFEVTLVNNVVGVLRDQWHLTALQASWILSIWFIGLMIGACGFGYLADRYGRKRLFLVTLLVYGIFTFLTAFAPSYSFFLVLRLLTAVGVGGEYAAVNAAISEFIPSRYRGRANATVMNFWSAGAVIAALLSVLVLSLLPPEIGWRCAFGLGALIALSTAVLRRYIPESPRWLASQGQVVEAEKVVASITSGHVPSAPVVAVVPQDAPRVRFWSQSRQLIVQYPGRLALGCLLDFSEASGYYGLFAFLALFILPSIGVGAAEVPWFYLVGNIGALLGGLLVAVLLDRVGRRITVTAFYALTASAMFVLMMSVRSANVWAVMGAFTTASVLATGSWISAYPTFTELFPTHLRSTGVGLSVAFGRLGAFSAPLLLTVAVTRYGMLQAFFLLAGFWVIGVISMIIWSLFGFETRGLTLEEIAPSPSDSATPSG